jgi:hypothetical protein
MMVLKIIEVLTAFRGQQACRRAPCNTSTQADQIANVSRLDWCHGLYQEAPRCISMNATLTTIYLIQKIKQGFFL